MRALDTLHSDARFLRSLRTCTPYSNFTAATVGAMRRGELEAFVAGRYRLNFGAELNRFLPVLIGFDDQDGNLAGVVGIQTGDRRPMFVERYLDEPAEVAVSRRLARDVVRGELVEVGNLAASRPGDSRALIIAMAVLLDACGYRWVLFAATSRLRNAFRRLQLQPRVLADARPERVRDDSNDWGSYYRTRPQVACGELAEGIRTLGFGQSPGTGTAEVDPELADLGALSA
jgi:hypothetical protein